MALLNIYKYMTPEEYFNQINPPVKKQYDALREFLYIPALIITNDFSIGFLPVKPENIFPLRHRNFLTS